MVVHVPPHFMSFQHAGDETWYEHAGADMTHMTCPNAAGASDENQNCADHVLATGIDAHLMYLGRAIGGGACTSSVETELEVAEEAASLFLSQ